MQEQPTLIHRRLYTDNFPWYYEASARVRALGDVITAPSALARKGAGGGGLFCVWALGGGDRHRTHARATYLTQNKPPPPAPFRVTAEGAWDWEAFHLPGLEPGRWPYQR